MPSAAHAESRGLSPAAIADDAFRGFAFRVSRHILHLRGVGPPAIAVDQLIEKQDRRQTGAGDDIARVRAEDVLEIQDRIGHEPFLEAIFHAAQWEAGLA
jgi:hypothetical protein